MKKVLLIFVMVTLALAIGFVRMSQAQSTIILASMKVLTSKMAGIAYVKNEVLLIYPKIVSNKDKLAYGEIYKRLKGIKLKLKKSIDLDTIPGLNLLQARVCGGIMERWTLENGQDALNVVTTLFGTIQGIDTRYIIAPNTIVHPGQSNKSEAIKKIEVTNVMQVASNHRVNVAVLDTRLIHSHVQPTTNWDAFTLWNQNPNGQPFHHGMGVLSIIADPDPSVGIASGIAQTQYMRTCDDKGDCYDHTIVPAYCRAVHRGARVINMSFASFVPSDILFGAISDAQASTRVSVLNVAAAGNSRSTDPIVQAMIDASGGNLTHESPMFPAAWSRGHDDDLDSILAVGAVDSALNYAPFASVGNYIDVLAPGVNVSAYGINGMLYPASGTSFAAPYVSGAAAILISKKPNISAQEVESLIRTCTTTIPVQPPMPLPTTSAFVNIQRAVNQLQQYPNGPYSCP